MRLEDLLQCDASQLEAMTDAQLTVWFEPMFNVTRPERVAKKVVTQAAPKLKVTNDQNELLKGLGIDIGNLNRPVKRKY